MKNKNLIVEKGFIDEPVPENIDLKEEILRLKKEKNAVILAHYYVDGQIQDIADFVGDSLELARKAAQTDAQIILFAGVHFMAETAKILSPQKKVLIPDLKSGCPLADSMPAAEFAKFKEKYPEHFVVTYVNTTAEIKALSDITCTSSNAADIIASLPEDTKIIFGPDKNLGSYIKGITGRDMILWDGACPVHQRFSLEKLLKLKQEYPDALVLAHPESDKQILLKADVIGSTSKLLKFAIETDAKNLIIATEPGIIHQMQKAAPDKNYIPLPPDTNKPMSICVNMKKHTLEKVYNALKFEAPEVVLEQDLIEKSYKPIKRMLDVSLKLGIIK